MNKTVNDKIDEFEAYLHGSFPMQACPVKHLFLPGLYIRTILMEKGQWVTSMMHNTVHPYFVLFGKISVFSENMGEEVIEAPFQGVTTPGTRRILFIHETCSWTTYHPITWITGRENELSDAEKLTVVSEIDNQIIEPYINRILRGIVKQNTIFTSKEIKEIYY